MAQLDRIIVKLLDGLPKTLNGWRLGTDLRILREVRIDHLGSVGTRLMLEKAKVRAPDGEFTTRASATFPRGPSGDFSRRRSNAPQLGDNVPQQRRVFAYAEYVFKRNDWNAEHLLPPEPSLGACCASMAFKGSACGRRAG